jgi:hypothetical protein
MSKDNLINDDMLELFITYFDSIETTPTKYSWTNINEIFDSILNNINSTNLIKNYYIFTILYINYTNYLKFINHNDLDNPEIYKLAKKIKYNTSIINNLLSNSDTSTVKKIIKLYNPFVAFSIKKNKIITSDNKKIILSEYLKNTKQHEKIFELPNSTYKKILDIVIYRFLMARSNNFSNFNEFYTKQILEYSNNNILDFDCFMQQIPQLKNILNIKISNSKNKENIENPIKIKLQTIINFFIKQNPMLKCTSIGKVNYEEYSITHIKYGGKIVISSNPMYNSNNNIIKFNSLQTNYSLVYFNTPTLKDFSFLKKTNNFIIIFIKNPEINDLSILLHFVHLITISIKILETYPTNIYECIHPLDYSRYYFKSFCNFLTLTKNDINTNRTYNKFIIDLIKYFYIYSYYDYYFYYSNNLVKTILSNLQFKNQIFNDFLNNLKTILKLPNELFSYPPFFDINDDINNLIYYSHEIPSYLKFYDFINAISHTFSPKVKNLDDFDVIKIITQHIKISNIDEVVDSSCDNDSSTENITVDTKTSSVSIIEDNKSRISTNILNNAQKNLINNKHTFIELDVTNSVNCVFNTEC